MRTIVRNTLLLILCIANSLEVVANYNPTDSLLRILPKKRLPQDKCSIYRNLADLNFEEPAEKTYLKLTIQEAEKAGNQALRIEALGDLACAYIKENALDSVEYYMDILRQTGDNEVIKCWITHLNIRLSERRVTESNIEATRKKMESKDSQEKSIYSQIEYACIIGDILLTQKKTKEAIPYLESATELSATLPFKDGFRVHVQAMHYLSRAYARDLQNKRSANLTEEIIKLRTKHYEQFYKPSRPFYYINAYYIQHYTTLFTNIQALSKRQIDEYLEKAVKLSKQLTNLTDKYCYYLILNNYYYYKSDYKNGLMACDSLIKYAKVVARYNLGGLYNTSSKIQEAMGNYKGALQALKTSHALEDSINTYQVQEQLNQLQVQYDVDKLNYENSQLEIRNKQILLFALSAFLFIVMVLCAYLYRNLKKEKRMKIRLHLLNTKAEESENMKTAFINSICHEIRTPLNSIVGFTELAFNQEIDEETRSTFPAEVTKNATLLTTLINSMLEVSNLDISDEKLPCESININAICQREIDNQRALGKEHLEYILDVPEQPLIIIGNERYLSLVLENLLNNAEKFTDSGSITLHSCIDKEQNALYISVTDTGCGIPLEKHEEVFQRFIKLDTYKQGSGLGLYLCRLIIKRLSGKISIDPTYTKGTRMLISLPTNV